MKVEINHQKSTTPGHALVPGKVYRCPHNELVIIMTGRTGVVNQERKGLVINTPHATDLPIGSLTPVSDKSLWIETEATLSLLI